MRTGISLVTGRSAQRTDELDARSISGMFQSVMMMSTAPLPERSSPRGPLPASVTSS